MSARNSVAPTLELISATLPGRLIQLDGDEIRIGRDPSSDIPLDLRQVSWKHARILRAPDGRHWIEDVGSYNATYLDGQRLTPHTRKALSDGGRIRICDVNLIYRTQVVAVRETSGDTTTILGEIESVSSLHLPTRPERALDVLRAVLEINRILGGTTELSVVLGRALDGVFAIFSQADFGFIVTSEPDGKLTPRATRFGLGVPQSLTISRTVLDHVLREGKALLISDVSDLESTISTESLNGSGVRTALCVPVFGRQSAPIGIIQIGSRLKAGVFSAEDLQLLSAVAVPIGMVIENHRLLRERGALAAAGEVQAGLLPKARPVLPGYSFWERYQPAYEVGGDYYDYIPVESDPGCVGPSDDASADEDATADCRRWAVAVGDVAGKGLPAALMMANLCAEVRHLVRSGNAPAEVVGRVNRQIHEAGLPGRFVTFVLALLDATTHELTAVNAGHMAPLIRRADGTIETLGDDDADIPLGIEPRRAYRGTTTTLGPGDVVVLYTDGVTEAVGERESFFQIDGLLRAVASATGGPERVGDAVLRALRAHVGNRCQSDDIAVVCFGRD